MIISFRHGGLKRLYEKGDRRRILARLDVAATPHDMNLPGYRLHRLSGRFKDPATGG